MGKSARVEIQYKFPSLNEYVSACRNNRFAGAKFKKWVQASIGWDLLKLPVFTRPVFVTFTWVEGNRKRDWDNVTFSKKFIFDALVDLGKLPNDGRKNVIGYSDYGAYEKGIWKVIVEIKEIDEEGGEQWSK